LSGSNLAPEAGASCGRRRHRLPFRPRRCSV